jgi:antitoxin FitA
MPACARGNCWRRDILEFLPMTLITIPLSEERLTQSRACAEQAGQAPEEFLRQRVEQFLDRPDNQFTETADQVLKKNAELYRRLA